MTPAELILDQTLADYYTARVLKQGDHASVVATLKKRAAQLQGLQEAMVQRRAQLEALERKAGDLNRRCFVSATHLACLRDATT